MSFPHTPAALAARVVGSRLFESREPSSVSHLPVAQLAERLGQLIMNDAALFLERYGYLKEARRVADKYVNSVCRTYAQTGVLWEKYHALDGSHRTTAEAGYLINPETITAGTAQTSIEAEPPAMMGWTAGVFIDAVAFLNGPSDPWLTLPHETLFPQTPGRR